MGKEEEEKEKRGSKSEVTEKKEEAGGIWEEAKKAAKQIWKETMTDVGELKATTKAARGALDLGGAIASGNVAGAVISVGKLIATDWKETEREIIGLSKATKVIFKGIGNVLVDKGAVTAKTVAAAKKTFDDYIEKKPLAAYLEGRENDVLKKLGSFLKAADALVRAGDQADVAPQAKEGEEKKPTPRDTYTQAKKELSGAIKKAIGMERRSSQVL